MKHRLILILALTSNWTLCFAQNEMSSWIYALNPGFTISKLKCDSTGMMNVLYPLIGLSANNNISPKAQFCASIQYSFRGSNHQSPEYKFRNSYVDLQISSKYSLNSFLKIQAGGQYSILFNSKFIIPNYILGTETTTLNGKYHSAFEIFTGIDFSLQKNLSVNLKYDIPFKSMEYKNFQVTLNIYLDKESFKRLDTSKENTYGMKYDMNGYIEENGIIYPSSVSSPPQFQQGLSSLYSYLENNVRVFARDYENNSFDEIDDNLYTYLYEINIDTTGKITALDLSESNSSSQGIGFQAGHLSNEIRQILESMPVWEPPKINEKPVNLTFYLPLTFKKDMNKIIIIPSKYMVPYNNRKNKK